MSITKKRKTGLLTVGIKILAGVALASNMFIGGLLYVNLQSSASVEQKVNEVLLIRQQLSDNLRAAIVSLQDEFLALPDFFRLDSRAEITAAMEREFQFIDRQVLKGREAYINLFSRQERRDLSKKQFVVQLDNGSLTISSGIFHEDGTFQESVERITVASDAVQDDAAKLRTIIAAGSESSDPGEAFAGRIEDFTVKIADAGLSVENTRNEILQHVEEIRGMENDLNATRRQQRQFTLLMGGLAVLANMLVLYFLVRLIVEKPLHKLTQTIDAIRAGESPEVPYLQRKDQIGILSGAIGNFREALIEISKENERKASEKTIIEKMFATMTSVVNSLENRAKELVHTAHSLQELAQATETRSENVSRRAGETAEHTNKVSESTVQLQTAFQDINRQIQDQNSIVATILESNRRSKHYNDELNASIKAITGIIATVEDITSRTKLLALNATIEAARAGTAGRSFAVVAGEVKELSYKTALATDDVKHKVEAIEEASSVLYKNLAEIDLRMETLGQRTGNITRAVAGQQLVTDNIAGLAGRTSENTLTVSTSINEVNAAAGSTRDLADRVHEFSSEISSQLTRLLQDTTTSLRQLADFSSPEPDPKSKVKHKEPLRLVTVHPAQSKPLFAALPPTGTTGA